MQKSEKVNFQYAQSNWKKDYRIPGTDFPDAMSCVQPQLPDPS